MTIVTDFLAIMITIAVFIVSLLFAHLISGWFSLLPVAWIFFYLWNEHRVATTWPK